MLTSMNSCIMHNIIAVHCATNPGDYQAQEQVRPQQCSHASTLIRLTAYGDELLELWPAMVDTATDPAAQGVVAGGVC